MSPKQYLNRARFIDERISAKIDQIESLHELAEKATSVISDMPKGGGKNGLEDIVTKIVSLEESVREDMNKLVDIRKEINGVISSVEDNDYRLILEKRYILQEDWDSIADELNMSKRSILRAHGYALNKVAENEIYMKYSTLFTKNLQK